MSRISIFLFEWKHFIRSPFKIVALLLFMVAGIYALHNGANLYKKQVAEIEKINEKADAQQKEYLAYYEKGEKGPASRPWIDMTTPFWAIWYTPSYHFKSPSPTLIYSIGQAEQYGFYKNITFRSSPYDADLAEEIANPERLQLGTLDFSFVVLYLSPLLLLIWLYNIKGAEADGGFLPLVYTQTGSKNTWLYTRVAFYACLLLTVIFGLMLYGCILTNVFNETGSAFWLIFLLFFAYLSFWTIGFALVLQSGNSSIGNTLKMVGLWILFAFIIPAAVHQWVSTKHPANLMTDLIDAQREDREKLFSQPDSVFQTMLNDLYPDIPNTPIFKDAEKSNLAMNRSGAALENEIKKSSIKSIEQSNEQKNSLLSFSHWFNPVIFFQNTLNSLTKTHYNNYQNYRDEIQSMVDKQLQIMVMDTWNGVVVDQKKYLEYHQKIMSP